MKKNTFINKGFTPTPNFMTKIDENKLKHPALKKADLVRGFTLIELILVIGIVATLAVIAFVALDPAKRFQDAREARRVSDVETILSAVHQFITDNRGAFPSGLSADTEQVLGTGSGCTNYSGGCDARVDACLDLTTDLERYLKEIPTDPQDGTAENTKYSILRNSNGIITIRACNAEGGAVYISR